MELLLLLLLSRQNLSGSPSSVGIPLDERGGERGGDHTRTEQEDAPASSMLLDIEEVQE